MRLNNRYFPTITILPSIFIVIVVLAIPTTTISSVCLENGAVRHSISERSTPVVIAGNAQMESFFVANGTTGRSWSSPYSLQDLEFNVTGFAPRFHLTDTSRFLKIRNCTFVDHPSGSNGALQFTNASNIQVEGCRFMNVSNVAVFIQSSSNLTITNCIFYGNNESIYLLDNNPGIKIQQSEFLSDGFSIHSYSNLNVVIEANIFEHGNKSIGMQYDQFFNITENSIFHSKNGLIVSDGQDNHIWNNWFVNNSVQAFDQEPSSNAWDNGTWGNCWSGYSLQNPGATATGRFWNQPYTLSEYNPSVTDNHSITACSFPFVAFETSKARAIENELISFIFTGAWEVGTIEISWQFGDGDSLMGQDVDHIYDSEGMYDITVNATDGNGDTRSLVRLAAITITLPGIVNGYVSAIIIGMVIGGIAVLIAINTKKRHVLIPGP
nr:NosD domain-containing protein [Candidatus Sigynarchaeota archaeon]